MPAPLFTSNPADFNRLEGLYIYETTPPGFIRGVNLGVGAVMGQCVRGPVDTPVEITSESRFLEVFGGRDYGAGGTLIGHVWRDLLNKPFGKLVVCRAAASAGVAASFTEEDTDGGAGTAIIRIDASSKGAWGNNVYFRIEAATDGDADHFNLVIRYLGVVTTYENLDTSATGNDNLLATIGDDYGNHVVVTKLADGRPLNTDSNTAPYLTALDTGAIGGYMALGTTVAGYTAVVGTEGTIAATDYTATDRALDKIKAYSGVGFVWSAEDDSTLTPTVNTAVVLAAAASSDRLFLIWTGDHTDSKADAVTYFNTLTDNDRTVNCLNSPYTLDTETATLVQTPPTAWMASILSQTDVDINPGEEATKQFTAGISSLTNESWTRDDYIDLRDAGIAALERDDGFVFVSSVVALLTEGLTEITRRRSADFLQLSAAARLKYYVKKKNLIEARRIMGGELVAFSKGLKNQSRIIEEFEVDQESVNTVAQRAQGLEYILWRVKLIGHILYLVLKTEIGTGVTIEV